MKQSKIKILKRGNLKVVSTLPNKDMFYGNPYGGAMDYTAAQMVNILLNQKQSLKVIECTFKGSSFLFESNMKVAIVGADMQWELDGKMIQLNQVFEVEKGQVLTGGFSKNGLRSYIALNNSIIDDDNETIVLGKEHRRTKKYTIFDYQLPSSTIIHIHRGPEWKLLNQEGKEKVMNFQGVISQNMDRMGAYLNGSVIELANEFPKMSVCTFPGVIQLLPNGQQIVLLQDAQTTGGYPRIAYLDRVALNQFNQLRPGTKIEWRLIL